MHLSSRNEIIAIANDIKRRENGNLFSNQAKYLNQILEKHKNIVLPKLVVIYLNS